MSRLGFVIPRYFSGIAGGAETLIASLALGASHHGHDVEILTTCAKDNRAWENAFEPGTTVVNGVTVRRFPVDARDLETWIPLQIRISQGNRPSFEEQIRWMEEGVNSNGLYAYLGDQGDTFDLIFFGPYLFGTTFWGAQVRPARSVLIPCLHDESYAYLDCISALFRTVRGCLFNARGEAELASRLYGGACVGLS